MSFVALDSAKTLSPVPRLLKLTLALFYACSTFDLIKLKGPTIFVNSANLLVVSPRIRFALGDSFRCSTALENLER